MRNQQVFLLDIVQEIGARLRTVALVHKLRCVSVGDQYMHEYKYIQILPLEWPGTLLRNGCLTANWSSLEHFI